jgi:hypothetical protein
MSGSLCRLDGHGAQGRIEPQQQMIDIQGLVPEICKALLAVLGDHQLEVRAQVKDGPQERRDD